MTGKISDFVGLLIFPIFVGLLIPKLKSSISIIVGFGFIIWKTPLVNSFIEFWSTHFFSIARTIDYTDYWAMSVLPVAHLILRSIDSHKFNKQLQANFHPIFKNAIVVLSIGVFCATSMPPPNYYPKGDILLKHKFKVDLSNDSVLLKLRDAGYNATENWEVYNSREKKIEKNYRSHYQIEEMVLGNQDTIKYVNFYVYYFENKNSIELINISVQETAELQDWKVLKSNAKKYRKLIEEIFKQVLDE